MASRILNISEATVIALHALKLIAEGDGCISSADIASRANVSRAHLSKVLRKLVAAGMLSVKKGPAGGFFLTKEQADVSYMQIFELFDGKCLAHDCVFQSGPCGRGDCIFGDFVRKLNSDFIKYFTKTKISTRKRK